MKSFLPFQLAVTLLLKKNEHCKKENLKLHALARCAKFMSTEKRSLIFKAFINAHFNYCTLVWMFHRKQPNNQINSRHRKALRGTYEDRYSSFSELHLVFYK